MITSSYPDSQAYIQDVEQHFVPPKITPPSFVEAEIPEPAVNVLDPNSSPSLHDLYPDLYYDTNHVSPEPEGYLEQGWTEENYEGGADAGFPRTAILSGSNARVRKLEVDTDAYVGHNLIVSGNGTFHNNVEVRKDLRVTGSTHIVQDLNVTGSANIGQDLRVTGSTFVSQNLAVTGNAYIERDLHVSGNVYFHSNSFTDHSASANNLYVAENARVDGNLGVTGNEYLTGSLYVNGDAVVTQSLFVNGDADITGNLTVYESQSVHGDVVIDHDLKVKGTASIDQTLVVYGKTTIEDNLDVNGDLYVTGSTRISESLYVSGNTYISGNTEISNSLTVHGKTLIDAESEFINDAYFHEDVVIGGDLTVQGTASYLNTDDLYVKDKSITVACGSVSPAQADGAGIDIDGAGVEFRYTSSTDRMGLNKGLDILGDENVTGSLYVTEDFNVGGDTSFDGDVNITENLTVGGDTVITGSLVVADEANFENDVRITGSLHLAEDANISGSVVIQEDLTVQGSTNLQDVEATTITASIISASQDIITQNISASSSGSFSDLYIEHSTTINGNGTDPSLVINTGSIEASNSDFTINNITASNISGSGDLTINNITGSGDLYMNGIISGAAFYGDATHMTGLTASVVTCSTYTASYVCIDASEIYPVNHDLDSVNVIVAVYETRSGSIELTPVQIIPERVEIVDENNLNITFGGMERNNTEGYIVVAKAGHVIEQSEIQWETFLENYNVHYGTTGSWQANIFSSITASADLGSFGEVDTARVGNKIRNGYYYPHYGENHWGEYLEFVETQEFTGINAYVRNANDHEEPSQVASLDHEGNLRISGSLYTNQVFSTSDIRKKDNIQNLTGTLEDIKKLRGVHFNWKDSGKPSIGVIAQEIEAIYPELTKVVKDFDGTEKMTVNYEGLVGVLIEAVKSLSDKVDQLENRLNNENR